MTGAASRQAASRSSPKATSRLDLRVYLRETRRVSMSLLFIAPLVLFYEIALVRLDPGARRAALSEVRDLLWYLGPAAKHCQFFLAALCAVAAYRVWQRGVPAWKLYPPFVVESALLAVLLGPLALFIATLGRTAASAPPESPSALVPALLASVGAGIYEELLFRLVVLGGLLLLLERVFALGRAPALPIAVLGSALAFAWYHQLGPYGEPFDAHRFGFRTAAGIILGIVFVVRGIGVAVYLHAFYDVLYDLRGAFFRD